ncbi:hypothetical protein C2S51_026084 [Perilla frutescens var. frutescens]|nr:hypothetical protein C2S51_026084 [Perilla frutescens var. frutescens]
MYEMATYTAVVSLMQDLEELLTSFDSIFRWSEGGFSPFTKRVIQNFYSAVSLMDSFLRDSSGLSYTRQFTLEKRITNVSLMAWTYIDFWAAKCLSRAIFSEETISKIGVPLTKMRREINSINMELSKIHRGSPSSTGKFNKFVNACAFISQCSIFVDRIRCQKYGDSRWKFCAQQHELSHLW